MLECCVEFCQYLELVFVTDDVEIGSVLPEEVRLRGAPVRLRGVFPCQPVPHFRIITSETPTASDTAPFP